ncbi:DHS-like NAD/FAD-binding domain-containing protein [Phlyctochytrium arcticum]|nr:DHS-like NAD/FAD-binding domain-containing protein [Phlyctochytrium arcticum]
MTLLLQKSQIRQQAQQVLELLRRAEGKTAILTGAGVSTDSGVPDYRGPKGIYVRNKDYKPIQFQQFVGAHLTRQRYWTRSYFGYPRITAAQPNKSHFAIHELQQAGWAGGLITQNVDGLHLGSDVVELHGQLRAVHCLSCNHSISRGHFQNQLRELNPFLDEWAHQVQEQVDVASSTTTNPDGDVETDFDYSLLTYPNCGQCGTGMLKPSVVFFGENIHPAVRDQSFSVIDDASALLVIGTSTLVYSAYRLALRANNQNKPVGIISLGPTRADALAEWKVEAGCSEVLEEVASSLC